ncbi:MAG: HEAT repeat domain-containing protein [Polyangiaceae bacterium]
MTTTLWKFSTAVSSSVALALAFKIALAPSPSKTPTRGHEEARELSTASHQRDAAAPSNERNSAHQIEDLSRSVGVSSPCQLMSALARVGGPEAVDAVGEALQKRRHERVRLCAIDALEKMPSLRATAYLAEAAREPSNTIRVAAIEAMVKSPDPSGRITLLEISRGDDPVRALEALLALADAHVSDAVPGLIGVLPRLSSTELVGALTSLGNSADSTAAPAIADYTTHPSVGVRQAAYEALGNLGGETAATLLRGVLDHARTDDLTAATRALGLCGDEHSRKALFDAVESPRVAVAQAALRALSEVDGDDVAQLMAKLISREPNMSTIAFEYYRSHPIPKDQVGVFIAAVTQNGLPSGNALEALSLQGGEAGREAIVDLARKNGPARVAALGIVESLPLPREEKRRLYIDAMREGGQVAETVLTHLGEDPSDEARLALQQAVQLGGSSAHVALSMLGSRSDAESEKFLLDLVRSKEHPELQHQALEALASIGSEGGRKTLLELASSDDPVGRSNALRLLTQTGGQESERAIAHVLEKGDAAQRAEAAELMSSMRGPKVVSDLEKLSRDADRNVKSSAMSSLVETSPDRASARARELLASNEPSDRVVALNAMASLPGMFDERALSNALFDADIEVNQAALSTLEQNGSLEAQELLASILHRERASESVKQGAAATLARLGGSVALREKDLIEQLKAPSEPVGEGQDPAQGAVAAQPTEDEHDLPNDNAPSDDEGE